MRRLKPFILLLLSVISVGCQNGYVPKPYGYIRIDLPENEYTELSLANYPYKFDISKYASAVEREEEGEIYWLDIQYDSFDATVHCSYKPIKRNLRELTDDAQSFVYKHAGKATSIPEQEFLNDYKRVYGVFFELKGNTASPYQFYLTDSVNNFFRGAVYVNCHPNQDSLAPVIDYLQSDIRHLIETFEWK